MDEQNRQDILDLISNYSYGYDDQDWELFESIWAEDATVGSVPTALQTRHAITEFYRSRREEAATAGRQPRHHTSNTVLLPSGDGRVIGRTRWFVHVWKAGELAPMLVNSGGYHDEFVQTPEGWRIASRRIEIDHG